MSPETTFLTRQKSAISRISKQFSLVVADDTDVWQSHTTDVLTARISFFHPFCSRNLTVSSERVITTLYKIIKQRGYVHFKRPLHYYFSTARSSIRDSRVPLWRRPFDIVFYIQFKDITWFRNGTRKFATNQSSLRHSNKLSPVGHLTLIVAQCERIIGIHTYIAAV